MNQTQRDAVRLCDQLDDGLDRVENMNSGASPTEFPDNMPSMQTMARKGEISAIAREMRPVIDGLSSVVQASGWEDSDDLVKPLWSIAMLEYGGVGKDEIIERIGNARHARQRIVRYLRRSTDQTKPDARTRRESQNGMPSIAAGTNHEPDRWDRAIMRAVERGAHRIVDIVEDIRPASRLSKKRTSERIRQQLVPAGYMTCSGSGKGFQVLNTPKGKTLISRKKAPS